MSKKKFVLDKKTIVNLFNENKFNKISKYSKSLIDYYETDIDICKLVIASEINLKHFKEFLKKNFQSHMMPKRIHVETVAVSHRYKKM